MSEEWFELVDVTGRIIGKAKRSECHGNPSLMHQSIHVLIFDRQGRLLLQKRSQQKDTNPGKWDTSVGGHVAPGEQPDVAARRETNEELGIDPGKLELAYQYIWKSDYESELVRTYATLHEGPFTYDTKEVETGEFWTLEKIENELTSGHFTPQFCDEFPKIKDWWRHKQVSMTHFTR